MEEHAAKKPRVSAGATKVEDHQTIAQMAELKSQNATFVRMKEEMKKHDTGFPKLSAGVAKALEKYTKAKDKFEACDTSIDKVNLEKLKTKNEKTRALFREVARTHSEYVESLDILKKYVAGVPFLD